ncbi:hypothetical protein ACGFJ7_35255 [Actinoplanes sp. NPDC048988]|uniref:hypothetical protein n=1 Tax=Actinoplanes sp. NPDC048988 TaxID=3363901 RepID=UPI00371BFCAF
MLTETRQLVRRAIGPFALDRVRVYSDSEETPCSDGFYHPGTGDVAIHRTALNSRHRARRVLLHEAGHRVAHRGGGRWLPIGDYHDRSRGFEQVLDDFSAVLLDYLAAGAALPELPDEPLPAPRAPRLAAADDPAVPAVRRELAHLLLDQLPHALTAGGFTGEKDLVASTGVHPDYWRTLTNPKVTGHRQQRGGRAWDYDKVALLAQAAGIHPPVVWLGYHLCEGPIYGRARRRGIPDLPDVLGHLADDSAPDPNSAPARQHQQPHSAATQRAGWTKKMRDATLRACADLQSIGGAYAEQIPALHALIDGRTTAVIGDDRWHAPARTLLALERQRLLSEAEPA